MNKSNSSLVNFFVSLVLHSVLIGGLSAYLVYFPEVPIDLGSQAKIEIIPIDVKVFSQQESPSLDSEKDNVPAVVEEIKESPPQEEIPAEQPKPQTPSSPKKIPVVAVKPTTSDVKQDAVTITEPVKPQAENTAVIQPVAVLPPITTEPNVDNFDAILDESLQDIDARKKIALVKKLDFTDANFYQIDENPHPDAKPSPEKEVDYSIGVDGYQIMVQPELDLSGQDVDYMYINQVDVILFVLSNGRVTRVALAPPGSGSVTIDIYLENKLREIQFHPNNQVRQIEEVPLKIVFQ